MEINIKLSRDRKGVQDASTQNQSQTNQSVMSMVTSSTTDVKRASGPRSAVSPRVMLDSPGVPAYTLTTIRALAQHGYMKNPIVYRAIRLIAEMCSNIPLHMYAKNSVTHEIIDSHPFMARMQNPNPTQTKFNFMDKVMSHWMIAGTNYLFGSFPQQATKLNSVPPSGLYCLPPYYVTPHIDYQTSEIDYYRYDYGSGYTDYPPWKILPLKFFHPLDELNGFSPLFAASMAIDRMNEGEKWNISLMQHAARPSGAFIAQGNLSEPDFDVLKQEIEDKYTGANRAGVPMLLEGGLTYVAMGLSPLQIDWLNGDADAGRKIAMAIGVDPLLLNDKQHTTYNNVEQARIALIDQTVLPMLMRYCEEMNLWIGGYYGGDGELGPDMKYIDMLKHDRQGTSIMVVAEWNNGARPFRSTQGALGIEPNPKIPEFYKFGPTLFVREDDIVEWLEQQHKQRMAPPPLPFGAVKPPSGNPLSPVAGELGKNPEKDTLAGLLPAGGGRGAGLNSGMEGLNASKGWALLQPREVKSEQAQSYLSRYESIQTALSDYFEGEKQAVLTAIQAARGVDEQKHAALSAHVGAASHLPTLYVQHYAAIADDAARTIQAAFCKSTLCSIYKKDALAMVTNYAATHLRDFQAVTEQALVYLTETVTNKGELLKAVDSLYTSYSTQRAPIVALRECVAAYNMGAYLGALQSNLPLQKTWVATSGHNHEGYHGYTLELKTPFVLPDGAGQFPCDTALGMSSNNGCTCILEYSMGRKYNPYHDERGLFTDSSSDTGGGGSIASSGNIASLPTADQQKLLDFMASKGVTMDISTAQGKALMEQAMHQGNFQEAADWYNRAASAANALAVKNGLDPSQTAGVLAALSPQNAWDKVLTSGMMTKPNLSDAMAVIDAYKINPETTITPEIAQAMAKYDAKYGIGFAALVGTTKPFNDYTTQQKAYLLTSQTQSYPASLQKALSILGGASPDSALGGPKVRSFYNNIRYPDTSTSSTIDTWMAKLLSGPNSTKEDAIKTLNGIHSGALKPTGAYPYYQSVIENVAKDYGVLPMQAQAIMWVQGRINANGGTP